MVRFCEGEGGGSGPAMKEEGVNFIFASLKKSVDEKGYAASKAASQRPIFIAKKDYLQ